MTKKEIQAFEDGLIRRGYKLWNSALYGTEDYDVSRLVKDDEKDLYQIIYKFWDWTKYRNPYEEGSIDLVIMPCFDGIYGRADLQLSWFDGRILDVDWVENLAKEYYEFITKKIV